MTRSRVRQFAVGLFVLVGVCGLLPSAMRAQAPVDKLPQSGVTVSSGPHTNLFNHIMKKAEVLAALAQVQDSRDLYVKTNQAVTLRASSNTTKLPWKLHLEADEQWFVYRGLAKVSLAPFSLQLGVTPPGNTYDVGEGDVITVPRGMAYQIMPAAGRFEYVAVRNFAVHVATPGPVGGTGGRGQTPLSSPVTTKAQIQQAYDAGTAGTAGIQPGINRIIFDRAKGPDWHQGGAPGPWENHERDAHVDFVVYGTAKCIIDGFITGADWDTRGLMGHGVVGGTEDTVGPGDIVFVFRNTPHFFDPISTRFGYLLVNTPQSEPDWPKSMVPNGTGAY